MVWCFLGHLDHEGRSEHGSGGETRALLEDLARRGDGRQELARVVDSSVERAAAVAHAVVESGHRRQRQHAAGALHHVAEVQRRAERLLLDRLRKLVEVHLQSKKNKIKKEESKAKRKVRSCRESRTTESESPAPVAAGMRAVCTYEAGVICDACAEADGHGVVCGHTVLVDAHVGARVQLLPLQNVADGAAGGQGAGRARPGRHASGKAQQELGGRGQARVVDDGMTS